MSEPAFRNLETVLACWTFGTFASLAIVGVQLRGAPVHDASGEEGGKGWTIGKLRSGLMIWPSDLALFAITFADGFILASFVTQRELGVYVFFWTFANTVQSLLQASIVTPELPRLIIRFHQGPADWMVRLRFVAGLIASLALVLSAGALVFIYLVHTFVPEAKFPWSGHFALLLFAGMIMRFASDYLSTALSSAGLVQQYIRLNIAYALMVAAFSYLGTLAYGMTGTAIGALIAAVVAVLMKSNAIKYAIKF